MPYRELDGGREFVVRLETGTDWREGIEEIAAEAGIDAGFFFGLGAVSEATVLYYDQDRKEYLELDFEEPLEVAACVGNIAWLGEGDDQERFAHTHAVCSRSDGSAIAGHLDSATVFAGELYLRELDGRLDREHHAETDLDLWMV